MGESVDEATLKNWVVEIGGNVSPDEPIAEVSTDKVDNDVVSDVEGILIEQKVEVDQVVKVGEVIAVIEIKGDGEKETVIAEEIIKPKVEVKKEEEIAPKIEDNIETKAVEIQHSIEDVISYQTPIESPQGMHLSPLVKSIAEQEGISAKECEAIEGTGEKNRITKRDILAYLKTRNSNKQKEEKVPHTNKMIVTEKGQEKRNIQIPSAHFSNEDEVIELSRMGKLISTHMTESLKTSAHVQSFVDVDITNLFKWREREKEAFYKKHQSKLTFTPIFIKGIADALQEFPHLNSTFDGEKVFLKKQINIGMATALPDGNLIVPVVKNVDFLTLTGIANIVQDLSNRARNNTLNPDDVQGGTYTMSNIGGFGMHTGTPIINQPQVGILAFGAIRKEPAVIETKDGDFIGIRKKMMLAHSYDHRVINGAMGSYFLKSVADYIENWDENFKL